MLFSEMAPQLQHGTQHQKFASGHRPVSKGRQGGTHAAGIRIVGIVDNPPALHRFHGPAHPDGTKLLKRRSNPLPGSAACPRHSHSPQDIFGHEATRRWQDQLDGFARGPFTDPQLPRSQRISGIVRFPALQRARHHRCGTMLTQQREKTVVAIQNSGSISRQLLQQRGLLGGNRFERLKKLDMHLRQAGHHCQVRHQNIAQQRHLARMADARFNHPKQAVLLHGQKTQRQADFIIEVACRSGHLADGRQHVRRQFLGRCLAHAAGDPHHPRRHLLPIARRQPPQRRQRIGHAQEKSVDGQMIRWDVLAHQRICLRSGNRRQKIMAVDPLAFQRHKQTAGLHCPAIDTHLADGRRRHMRIPLPLAPCRRLIWKYLVHSAKGCRRFAHDSQFISGSGVTCFALY